MKVSKDQHLKAERKCLSAAAAEGSVTRGQTPGTIWGYHTSTFFLQILANMYRERKTWSSLKFGERKKFLAKMTFSRWKNLEQPSYIIRNIYVLAHYLIRIHELCLKHETKIYTVRLCSYLKTGSQKCFFLKFACGENMRFVDRRAIWRDTRPEFRKLLYYAWYSCHDSVSGEWNHNLSPMEWHPWYNYVEVGEPLPPAYAK